MNLKTDQLSAHQPNQPTLLIGSPGTAKNALLTQFMFNEFSTNAALYYVGSMASRQLERFLDDHCNLIDLDHADQSFRFNPINYKSITDIQDALRIARLLYLNLGFGNFEIDGSEGAYYTKLLIDYLAAIVWYLRSITLKNARHPLSLEVCTIPHLIEFVKLGHQLTLPVLASVSESAQLIKPISETFAGNAEIGQLIGRIASLEIHLKRWGTPGLYWILAPGNPIVQGVDFTRMDEPLLPDTLLVRSSDHFSHSATLALYTDFICCALSRNPPTDHHRALILDSYQSFEYPYLDQLIATGRSQRIHLYVAFDFVGPGARLHAYKSRLEFTTSCFGTVLIGRQLIPEEAEFIASVPTLRGTVSAATLQDLHYGEFAGWLGTAWNKGYSIRGYEPFSVGYSPHCVESAITDSMLVHVNAIQVQVRSLLDVEK